MTAVPITSDILDAVSGERMAALAGDGFAGRRVGAAGGAAARTWLGQHLAEVGAAVTFEPFTGADRLDRGGRHLDHPIGDLPGERRNSHVR